MSDAGAGHRRRAAWRLPDAIAKLRLRAVGENRTGFTQPPGAAMTGYIELPDYETALADGLRLPAPE